MGKTGRASPVVHTEREQSDLWASHQCVGLSGEDEEERERL